MKELTPKEHILSIRRKYTGENSDINRDGEKVVSHLTEILTDAIEELSSNIYKKDSHFIMELIQNADDNNYKLGIKPTLIILQNDEQIIFQNNELGFSKENIESICNIRKSTKSIKNGNKGYIGEKGIGFKSVFRVCDEPEIYSNGYQFKFNSNTNLGKRSKKIKLGFILPEWIDEKNEFVKSKFTNIVLPFKSKLSSKDKKKLSEINPDLLLFLNKLCKLQIIDENENKRVVIEKEQSGNEIVLRLTEKQNGKEKRVKNNYFIFDRSEINVPSNIDIKERKGIKKTRILLAFPHDQKNNLITDKRQKVYSFLPIGESGFRFLIQADFILTSGREGIVEDNQWNLWIRDEILTTFKLAIKDLKIHPQYKYDFLNFIPNSDEYFPDFFEPLRNDIIEYCKNSNIVLSDSNKWLKAEDVVTVESVEKSLFENSLLKKAIGKEYVNSSFKLREEIISTLEIDYFTRYKIYKCLNEFSIIKKKEDKWFVELFIYLSSNPKIDEISKRLKEIKIVPIQNLNNNSQNLIATKDNFVFFPISQNNDYLFEKDINVISSKIFNEISSIKNKIISKQVINFLSSLNIKQPTPYTIIENYILKKYESDAWRKCLNNELRDHLRYIKDHWIELKRHQSDIKDWFINKYIIRCADRKDGKNYFTTPENIYISKLYGNNNKLEELFEGLNDINFIHEYYFNNDKNSNDRKERHTNLKEWYNFFISLECNDMPIIKGNYSCPDFVKILDKKNPGRVLLLIKFVNRNWNTYRRKLYNSQKIKSDWFKQLSENKLIPVGNEFYFSNQIFLKTDKNEALYGNLVKYFSEKIELEFAIELGFNVSITGESIINYLRELSRRKIRLTKEKANKLYSFLNRDDNTDFSRFYSEPLIYLPNTQKWYEHNEVFWSDYSKILGSDYGYCEKNYLQSLKELFVEKIEIQEIPDVEILVNCIKEIEENLNDELPDSIEKQKIYNLFSEIGTFAIYNKLDKSTCEDLKDHIWTNKGEFWSNNSDIFYNDDDKLFELYKDEPDIAFFDIPIQYLPKTTILFSLIDIKALTLAVNTKYINNETATLNDFFTLKLRFYAKTIIDLLYTKYTVLHEDLKKTTLLNNFNEIKIYEVPELEIIYNLNGIEKKAIADSFQKGNRIYLNRESKNKLTSLAFEIDKYFKYPGIIDFIIILLTSKKNVLDYVLKQKNIIPPPDDLEDENISNEFVDEENNSFTEDESEYKTKNDKNNFERKPQKNGLQENEISIKSVWKPDVTVNETEIIIEDYVGQKEEKNEINIEGRVFNKSDFINSSDNWYRQTNLTQADIDSIANFGEEKVYFELKRNLKKKYLKCKIEEDKVNKIFKIIKAGKILAELKWLNVEDKIQEGYDLTLLEGEIKKYYEVKTTTGNTSTLFRITSQQWNFIKAKGANYSIVRVINAGNENVGLIEINNPYQMWKDEKLKAYPINIELD